MNWNKMLVYLILWLFFFGPERNCIFARPARSAKEMESYLLLVVQNFAAGIVQLLGSSIMALPHATTYPGRVGTFLQGISQWIPAALSCNPRNLNGVLCFWAFLFLFSFFPVCSRLCHCAATRIRTVCSKYTVTKHLGFKSADIVESGVLRPLLHVSVELFFLWHGCINSAL